jgi:DNA-binding MurR/RpiR family transcriptional regulator
VIDRDHPELINPNQEAFKEIGKDTMKENSLKPAKESIEIESLVISGILDYLDDGSFSKAIDVLNTCPKIITCASGSSGIAARKIAHSLCYTERNDSLNGFKMNLK